MPTTALAVCLSACLAATCPFPARLPASLPCPYLPCVDVLAQIPKRGRGAKGGRPVNRDRFISKMFLRGDSVILVLRNPK
jgi:hypothetical protein